MDKPLTSFLTNTYSLPQARRRLSVLKNYLNEKFFNQPVNESLSAISPEDEEWLKSLPEEFLKNFTKLNCQNQIEDLRTKITNLEPLIIYLPLQIPDIEIDKIGTWLRKNTSQVIFDTKLNPTLLGGGAFSLKGVSRDYSLKLRIDAQREKILASMKGLLK